MGIKLADVDGLFQKDSELKKEDYLKLKDWVLKQPHLPKITDLQIIMFLQSCYYSNEAAKTALDNYYTVKTICTDIFGNRNPNNPSVRSSLNTSLITVLPNKTREGFCVNYMKLMDCNPDVFNLSNQCRYFDMVSILHLQTQGPCHGYVMVIDMEGAAFGHFTKINPIVCKKFLYYLQDAMPVRLKGLHFVNTVSWMDKLLAIIKPFMKKDLWEMLQLHTKIDENFYKYVPKECLPRELGGMEESLPILHEKTKQTIIENAEFFKAEDLQVVNESRRVGKAKNAGDFFGIEGTFKKLQVD